MSQRRTHAAPNFLGVPSSFSLNDASPRIGIRPPTRPPACPDFLCTKCTGRFPVQLVPLRPCGPHGRSESRYRQCNEPSPIADLGTIHLHLLFRAGRPAGRSADRPSYSRLGAVSTRSESSHTSHLRIATSTVHVVTFEQINTCKDSDTLCRRNAAGF